MEDLDQEGEARGTWDPAWRHYPHRSTAKPPTQHQGEALWWVKVVNYTSSNCIVFIRREGGRRERDRDIKGERGKEDRER